MKKIGILGGTFDPIHFGHVRLAEQALCECHLDKIIVIPAYIQPFKVEQTVTDGTKRLEMARLAFEFCDKIEVSDLEIKEETVSYTINTLRKLKTREGQEAKLFFIVGTDAFIKVEKWFESDEILGEYSFIVGMRPGYRTEELFACIDKIRAVHNTDIVTINNKQIPISSTELKERIKSGKDCKAFLPEKVERYIYTNGLYKTLY